MGPTIARSDRTTTLSSLHSVMKINFRLFSCTHFICIQCMAFENCMGIIDAVIQLSVHIFPLSIVLRNNKSNGHVYLTDSNFSISLPLLNTLSLILKNTWLLRKTCVNYAPSHFEPECFLYKWREFVISLALVVRHKNI